MTCQRIAKGSKRRGHVKKRQGSSQHQKTIHRRFCAGEKKASKPVRKWQKQFSTLLGDCRAAPSFLSFLGGSERGIVAKLSASGINKNRKTMRDKRRERSKNNEKHRKTMELHAKRAKSGKHQCWTKSCKMLARSREFYKICLPKASKKCEGFRRVTSTKILLLKHYVSTVKLQESYSRHH